MKSDIKYKGGSTAILWILATALGWSVGLFSVPHVIKTPSDFFQTILILGGNGLITGLLMGMLQWKVLRQLIMIPKSWITATIFGCFCAEIFGGVFAVGFPLVLLYFKGEGVSGWEFLMTPFYLVFGGFFVGLFQSNVLSRCISKTRNGSRIGLLWFIGTWLGVGLGIFATGYANNYLSNFALPNILFLFLGRLIAGAVLGLTTFVLLQIVKIKNVDLTVD